MSETDPSSKRLDTSTLSPSPDTPSPAPPEWMSRILRERQRRRDTREPTTATRDGRNEEGHHPSRPRDDESRELRVGQTTEVVRSPNRARSGDRWDTPTLDHGGPPTRVSQGDHQHMQESKPTTSRVELAQEAVTATGGETRQLMHEAMSTEGVQTHGDPRAETMEGSGTMPTANSHSYETEFSSASSTSSNTSHSTSFPYGGGTASSSSTSSSGFSSRASGSSVISDSSTTTFSVSSHERERDKDVYYYGGGSGRGRSWSAEPVEESVGETGATTPPRLGLGLYQSVSASPTYPGVTSAPQYYDQSPLSLSPNPSRSPSFDALQACPRVADVEMGRDPTLQASLTRQPGGEPARTLLTASSSKARSSSPTPSTSTLTIPVPSSPHPHEEVSVAAGSQPRPPSFKGKERAVIPPSPPQSTTTLTTTTTALSEIGSSDEERDALQDDLTLYPPENFAIVVPGIFRSSFPRKKNFAFLKSLGLKSVLTLIQDEYPQENLDFLEQEGIQLFQFPIPGNKEPFVHIPDDKIVAAMAVVLDSRNHPMLIHCNKGKHRTGCLVGVLRRLQTWSLTAIFDEYRRYSHPKSRQMDLQFIEAFKGLDLIWDVASQNRPHLPPWACTTPYSTPQRGKVPVEAKTKERSTSRAPSGRSSPILKELAAKTVIRWDEQEPSDDRERIERFERGDGKGS